MDGNLKEPSGREEDMPSELKRIIDQVSKDKRIDKKLLVATLEEAIRNAARKKFGVRHELEVNYNDQEGEFEVFEFKEVVHEVTDPETQIGFEEGRKLDPECEEGDSLGIKKDTSTFGRIAAQSAKQVIIQRMKDAERDVVFEDYKDRKGEIINGIVQRFDKGDIIVNLGRTEAVLPTSEQNPKESFRPGDRVRAYVLEVKKISRGPQVVLSRTHPNFIIALFENEVPEIAEKVVKILAVSREPGSRTKIAVSSRDSDIDPVGACVGMRGSRVQSVVQELRGEKIDIIPYHLDPAKFVCNALAPAEIIRVIIDEANKTMEVVVQDEQLSLAIGKKGQNVRLASKLTGWKIDVKSESKYNALVKAGYQSLLQIAGVGEVTADALYQAGFTSAREVAEAGLEELMEVQGVNERKAEKLKEQAQQYLSFVETSAPEGDGESADS
jgi:N utilization substance protein A